MRRIRVGIIGLGAIAQAVHLPNLSRLWDRYEVVHVCDVAPDLAGQVAGALGGAVAASTSPTVVHADATVEAVLILASGPHAPVVRDAIDAGKHVFVEKPLALTVGEARDLDRRARLAGRVLQVGYMKVHDPIVRQARTELSRTTDLRLLRVTVLHPTESSQQRHLAFRRAPVPGAILEAARAYEDEMTAIAIGDLPSRYGWLYREVGLGSIVHQLSVVRTILGHLPTLDSADAWPADPGTDTASSPTAPPTLSVSGTFSARARLRFDWVWAPDLPAYEERYEAVAPDRRVELSLPTPYALDQRTRLVVDQVEDDRWSRHESTGDHRSGFQAELEAFHDAITSGTSPSDAEGAAADTSFVQLVVAELARRDGFTAGGEAATGREAGA